MYRSGGGARERSNSQPRSSGSATYPKVGPVNQSFILYRFKSYFEVSLCRKVSEIICLFIFFQDKSVPDIIGTAIPRQPSTESNKTSGEDRIHLKKEDNAGLRKGVKVGDKGTEERRREESRRTGEQPKEDRRGTGERGREDSRGTAERRREDSRGGEERRREDSRGAEDWRREDKRASEKRRKEDSRGGDDRRGEAGYCCRETGSGQNKGSSMRQGSDMRVTEEEVAERLAARQETRRLEAQERQGAEQRRLLREQAEQRRLGVKELKVRERQIFHLSKLTVDICMGLLIHKTSLFLALIDKYLGNCEGGGERDVVPFSMSKLFNIDIGFLIPV